LIGGITSAWVLRIGELIVKNFFIGKVKDEALPTLQILIDLIVGLLMILIIIFMINQP